MKLEDENVNPTSQANSNVPPTVAEMVTGGVTVRRWYRKTRCFISGHKAVYIAASVTQCSRCYAVGDIDT